MFIYMGLWADSLILLPEVAEITFTKPQIFCNLISLLLKGYSQGILCIQTCCIFAIYIASIKSENQKSNLTESTAEKYSFYQELVNLILMNPVCFSQEQHYLS